MSASSPLARAIAVALAVLCGAACSIRQDGTGTTRTGVGLWGFGDPPGVNWNLDWPRREAPDLPASRPLELPPRAVEPGWWSSDDGISVPHANDFDRRGSAIGDNRACVSCCPSEAVWPRPVRALDRPHVPDRG